MSLSFAASGDFCVQAPATWFDPTQSFTVAFKFRPGSTTPSGGKFWNVWIMQATGPDPYIFFGSQINSTDLYAEIFDGTSFLDTGNTAAVASTWANIWLVYDSGTHITTLYIGGVSVGTIAKDLSTVAWNTDAQEIHIGGESFGDLEMSYLRVWQAAKTPVQLAIEAANISAVDTVGLLSDTPLQTSIDLTSHNNTLTQFMATGTVVTDTANDPLLSVVTGPPTNIDPTTATTVTLDSAFFQDTLTAGSATTTWTKCVATADEDWTAIAFGVFGGTYLPLVTVFEGLANAQSNTPLLNLSSQTNRPIQFPVTSGQTYYFQNLRNGAVTPATLIASVVRMLDLTIDVGTICINDDAVGYPLVFVERIQGYPIGALQGAPAGEAVDCLPSGIAALLNDDDTGDTLTLVQGTTILGDFNLGGESFDRVSSDQDQTFYVGSHRNSGTNLGQIITISDAGVIGPTSWDLPQTGMQSIGVNAAGTLAYYCTSNANNQAIRRFDLANNVALTNLVAGIANYAAGKDIIVMADNTILVAYAKGSATIDVKLVQYATDGSVVLSTSFGSNFSRTGDVRLARAIEAGHVWVWVHLATPFGFDQFYRVRLSDGAVVETVPNSGDSSVEYETGQYQPVATNTPVRSGHSESCGFYINRVGGPLPPAPLRLTQLPLEVAYDYAMLQPFIKGGGLNWVTPVKALT